MVWKINDRKSWREIKQKWNGSGMEMEWKKKMTNQLEAKFDGMEWEGNGNGMEKVGEK